MGGGGGSWWKQMIHSPTSNAATLGGVWSTVQKSPAQPNQSMANIWILEYDQICSDTNICLHLQWLGFQILNRLDWIGWITGWIGLEDHCRTLKGSKEGWKVG